MSAIREPTGILPITPENYPETIPDFANETEARDFWDTHDSSFYWDQMEDVADFRDTEPIPLEERPAAAEWLPRREDTEFLLSLGFPEEMIRQIRRAAVRRRIPMMTMLTNWVGERLAVELAQLAANTEELDKAS